MISYTTHSDARGRGGYGYVLKIKCHSFNFAEGGTDQQRQRAYDAAMESWWSCARLRAQELGFSDVYACGRSGGYIYPTLNNGRPVTTDDLDRSYSYNCENARRIVSMLRKFRDYVRVAMESANLAEIFAVALQEVMEADRESDALKLLEAAKQWSAPFVTTAKTADGSFYGAAWNADGTLIQMSGALQTRGVARAFGRRIICNMERQAIGPRFVKADGMLTRYAHACGYLDSATAHDDRMAVTLGYEGACFHVKARNYDADSNIIGQVWECFHDGEYRQARAMFRKLCRERGATYNPNYGTRA